VDENGAIRAAGKLLEALDRPFDWEGTPIYSGAGIGIALFPHHGETADALLRNAAFALSAAKSGLGGYALYQGELGVVPAGRLALIGELQQGIRRGELRLFYQPKIDLRSSSASNVEALVRWQHPTQGLLFPDRFIPLAERTGLIRPLTHWVLDEALGQLRRWGERGIVLSVTINLSARNLHERDLVTMIAGALARHDVEPARLQVEITESALVLDPLRALATLTELRGSGVTISIDDFGTGFSSLSYLRDLPLDEIKIDRSFVMDMARGHHGSAAIVRSVVELGHNLGMQVVAEGVESPDDLERLREMTCDLAQGYYLSRPVPPDEIEHWLEHWSGEN
jgi:EAL domain-containing protein (putative c-di-GMP-specific phosphodiesterase class I)